MGHDAARLPRELGPRELALADAVRHRVLRDRVHGHRGGAVRSRALRHGAHVLLAAPGRRADLRRPRAVQARARDPAHLAADGAAEVVHLDGRLRVDGRDVRQLRGGAGDRHDHPRGRLRARLPAAAGRAALRHHDAPGEGEAGARRRCVTARGDGAGSDEPALHPAVGDQRALRAVRQRRAPDAVLAVTAPFTPMVPGSANERGTPAPSTPKDVPHRGGPANPTADALRARFGNAIVRVDVVWGETSVVVDRTRVLEIVRWLHDDPAQKYEYLSDVTAVEFRDMEQPLEVVWHLRSLAFRRFLRLKALLRKGEP